MGMARNCENCTENCPQAERAHQASLGRMYATKEFTALLKKVESGELVEVVRCKECMWFDPEDELADVFRKERHCYCTEVNTYVSENHFCSYGERKDNG